MISLMGPCGAGRERGCVVGFGERWVCAGLVKAACVGVVGEDNCLVMSAHKMKLLSPIC